VEHVTQTFSSTPEQRAVQPVIQQVEVLSIEQPVKERGYGVPQYIQEVLPRSTSGTPFEQGPTPSYERETTLGQNFGQNVMEPKTAYIPSTINNKPLSTP
jgi:hypothetical protein